MIVKCAWCEKAGRPCDMGQDGKEPLDRVTHAICPTCYKAELEATPEPPTKKKVEGGSNGTEGM